MICLFRRPEEIFLSTNNYTIEYTPKFLYVHSIVNHSENELKSFQALPRDEYDVKTLNIFYNKAVGISFCLVDAPNREAVERHHEKYGVKCTWITEVQATA